MLPADARSVPEARRAVERLGLAKDAAERLEVVVSELITNAIKHGPAPGPVLLHLVFDGGCVRGVVSDPGSGFSPHVPAAGDLESEGGLGLVIVSAIVDRWRVGPPGTSVLFEMSLGERADELISARSAD